jgi:hypothetical protein
MKLLEIIGVNFQHNRSTTDNIFSICLILEKKWEYNETVYQLFIDFEKACDLVGLWLWLWYIYENVFKWNL